MANNTLTFDPNADVAYGVNLSILTGADFKSTFKVQATDKTNFDFNTGAGSTAGAGVEWTGSSQMRKSTGTGSTTVAAATFTVGFTSASSGEFEISLGSTATRNLAGGRYMYDILVSSGSSIFRIVEGNINVIAGVSSAP